MGGRVGDCQGGFVQWALQPFLLSSDKRFPAFGFGARIPPNFEVGWVPREGRSWWESETGRNGPLTVHRCPMTLLSTLTRKILNVKVRGDIPTSLPPPQYSLLHTPVHPMTKHRLHSHGPSSLTLYPFSAWVHLVRLPDPGPSSTHPTAPVPGPSNSLLTEKLGGRHGQDTSLL